MPPKKSKQKQNRRQRSQFPAFKPTLNLKSRNDEIFDIDYLDKLEGKDRQWMNNFMEEWIHANPNHKGKVFHKTKKQRKIIYDKNNARNRDGFIQSKIRNNLDYHPNGNFTNEIENPIDMLILKYDLVHNKDKKKKRRS